jgi:feruloyl esterase
MNRWRELSYPDLAGAYARGLALQPAFSNINTDDPDLRGLRRSGGKVLSYHGLADDLIMPQGSTNYFTRVAAAMGGVREVWKFNRLFLIPALAHDGGLSRPGSFDPATGATVAANKVPLPQPVTGRDELFKALQAWVETGKAPRRIEVSSADGSVTMPLCMYPRQATHIGAGSTKSADSYACTNPRRGSGGIHDADDDDDDGPGRGHDHRHD